MRLTDLLNAAHLPPTASPVEITQLCTDSRKVGPGALFAALPGNKLDGRAYIEAALAAGAAAILAPLGTTLPSGAKAVLLGEENPRLALAKLAAAFYAPLPQNLMAVTGTNGKTSVVNFAQQIINATGTKAAAIGTLGISGPGVARDGALTTPDAVALAQDLGALKAEGFDHVALEASSHGLDQFRIDGLTLKAAGYTYLGRDHLDYHLTLENYLAAKALLFSRVLPQGATAVLNADVPEFAQLESIVRARGQQLFTYGQQGREMHILSAQPHPEGLELEATLFGHTIKEMLPVAGPFQAGNILCALGLVVGCGVDPAKAIAALPQIRSVRGRLELVGKTPQNAGVYVDYAHTPDALETVLKALRAHTTRRLHVVFGCGGNRDKGKRPVMGEIAARLADRVIVTDDNPRFEDPVTIRAEILNGCPAAEESDSRAKAIQTAIKSLEPGDTLIIAGKGHEQGQIVGDQVLPFDDALVARLALKELS